MSAGITLTGGVVADPELKFGATGLAILNMRVATSQRRFNKATSTWEDHDQTYWTVSAFNALAENAAESLRKGDRVIVVGKMKSRQWIDRDNNKRTAWEVTADHIGADLTRATASLTRIKRDKPTEPVEDPWSNTGLIPVQDETAPF